jgi:hypothetical protein
LITAPLVTCAVVGTGIAMSGSGAHEVVFSSSGAKAISAAMSQRTAAPSRSASRVVAAPTVTRRLWTTGDLDLRLTPETNASTRGDVPSLRKVGVTGVRRNGYAQVVLGARTYWVTADYLAAAKPTDPADLPLSDKPCPSTSGVEYRLKPGAIRVWEAVCNNFPQITQYGGYAPRGEHADGKAIDIMTSDVSLGDEIAAFLQAHAAQLDLFDVIWRQHIWTPVRASEGWRAMPSRGSETANHMDHVHVSTN